jgi:acyl-coenzyme A thioesterase PaaI-like protein
MKQLETYLVRAQKSKFWLWVLNKALHRLIPFNAPHNIRLVEIGEQGVKSMIPYKRLNLNHIKGIHACGLATVAEFTSGLVLLRNLNPADYRLIMESIEVKYHFQAKSSAIASFEITKERVQNEIIEPLKTEDAVFVRCEIPVHDADQNLLCTVYTNWQIKSWKKVKTKL